MFQTFRMVVFITTQRFTNMKKEEAIRRSYHWWYCDNIVNRKVEIGLLKMDFPQVFILIRDPDNTYFASFEEFKAHLTEVNFFNSKDRKEANLEEILIDAWNFMALQEEEEERLAAEREEEDDIF